MRCKWQVEIDGYCLKVLEKHWPNVPKFKDVREVGKHNLEPVDLICGGFPCQPWSVAGKRRGTADDRNLWPEMFRVVRELRPTYVLGENVPGIAPYLDTILDDLESQGYETVTLEIPAAAFDAPHLRYRIFIVAHANGRRCESDGVSRRLAEIRERWADFSMAASQLGADVANAQHTGLEIGGRNTIERGSRTKFAGNGAWSVEPSMGRVADGAPHRVDRLKGLGNAVVPQVAEWIGRKILEHEQGKKGCT